MFFSFIFQVLSPVLSIYELKDYLLSLLKVNKKKSVKDYNKIKNSYNFNHKHIVVLLYNTVLNN